MLLYNDIYIYNVCEHVGIRKKKRVTSQSHHTLVRQLSLTCEGWNLRKADGFFLRNVASQHSAWSTKSTSKKNKKDQWLVVFHQPISQKNMRKSNWSAFPQGFGVKMKNVSKPPTRSVLTIMGNSSQKSATITMLWMLIIQPKKWIGRKNFLQSMPCFYLQVDINLSQQKTIQIPGFHEILV